MQDTYKDNTKQDLKEMCQAIADYLTNPEDFQADYARDNDITEQDDINNIGASEWLGQALDVQYLISSSREFISAKVLVACGGPNIWVDFDDKQVKGYWGTTRVTRSFTDNLGVEDYLVDLWQQ